MTLVLRLGVAACFAGWAWQHIRWSVPYDAVLWNPSYFGWLANALGVSWESYVAEVVTDYRIRLFARGVGLGFVALSVVAMAMKRTSKLGMAGLAAGSVSLALIAFCKYVNAGNAVAMFVEYGGQILAPLVLMVVLRWGPLNRWAVGIAAIGFWATFMGHGIYALGIAPTPGHFYGMVAAVLGLGERGSTVFLEVAGVLDFVVCIGVLVPAARSACLVYAAIWGLMTALARPVAGMSLAAPWWGADQFVHEAVLRMPHVALPLFLLLAVQRVRVAS